jgi:hypothetical protein
VTGLFSPNSLAVDSVNVYWADGADGTVMQANIMTGAMSQVSGSLSGPQSLVLSINSSIANTLFWVEPGPGNVDKALVGGGSDVQLASDDMKALNYVAVANNSSQAFFTTSPTNLYEGGVWTSGGGAATLITSLGSAKGGKIIAVAGTSPCTFDLVYFFTSPQLSQTIQRAQVGCGTVSPTTLASGGAVVGLARDATNAYWVDGAAPGTVAKVPLGGGSASPIISQRVGPTDVAVDSLYVYWIEQGPGSNTGAIMQATLSGTSPTVLASGQVNPRALFLTSAAVYWVSGAEGDCAVLTLPK